MKIDVVLMALAAAVTGSAGVVGFVNNPTTNSTDWATSVANLGGVVNTTVNFDTLSTGALNPNAYSGIGLTLAGTGGFTTISNGVGPAQSNTFATPLSPGEGVHPASNYVGTDTLPQQYSGDPAAGTFTVSFATPVLAAGLFTIDLFDPAGYYAGFFDDVTLQAFTGANGTGTLLGTFSSAQFNYQASNLYFMGIVSTNDDIGSIVFTEPVNSSNDLVGLDHVEFATPGSTGTPEPGTFGLVGGLLLPLWLGVRKLRGGKN